MRAAHTVGIYYSVNQNETLIALNDLPANLTCAVTT
jgi:hypothetical protein